MTRFQVCILALLTFTVASHADEQDDAIAHVVALKGQISRDFNRPERPVVGISFAGNSIKDLDLKKLAAFPDLTSLNLGYTMVTDSVVMQVKFLESLRELDLSQAAITGLAFQSLADSKIEKLNLTSANIGDVDLKDLTGMKSLTSVAIGPSRISETGIQHVASIPNLTSLSLQRLELSEAGLKALAAAKKLKSLQLVGTRVSDAGLKEIAAITSLTDLDLFGLPVTEVGLKALAGLKLTRICLSGKQLIDDDLKTLSAWPDLTTLWISNASITDAGAKLISSFKKLTDLRVNSTRIGDAGLKEIASLSELQTLMFFDTRVTPAGILELAPLKRLTLLTVNGSITDEQLVAANKAGLIHAIDCCVTKTGNRVANRPTSPAEVYNISMISVPGVSALGIRQFAACKNLKELIVTDSALNDAAMKELLAFSNLESLLLAKCTVTDAGARDLAKLTSLKKLFLNDHKITELGLKELASLTKLQELHLDRKISQQALTDLQKALPRCKITGSE